MKKLIEFLIQKFQKKTINSNFQIIQLFIQIICKN